MVKFRIPKIRYAPSSKCSEVLYGHVYSEEIISLVKSAPIAIFDPTLRRLVYLRPLAVGLYNWLKFGRSCDLTFHYFLAFLLLLTPRRVFTAVDHDRNFYAVRAAIVGKSNTQFVVFQNGIRWKWELEPVASLANTDLFFCMSEHYQNYLLGKVSARIIPIGTLMVQKAIQEADGLPLPFSAAFISTWRKPQIVSGEKFKSNRGSLVPFQEFYAPETNSLPSIQGILKGLGVPLTVLGSSNDPQERDFYVSLLDYPIDFKPRLPNERQYNNLLKHSLILTTDSTLGYEALILGRKVVFIDSSPFSDRGTRFPIGYPGKLDPLVSSISLRHDYPEQWSEILRSVLGMTMEEYWRYPAVILGKATLGTSLSSIAELLRD